MSIDTAHAQPGWLAQALAIPSVNCDQRPAGTSIDLIVIHAISLPPGEFGGSGISELFTNRLDPEAHPYYAGIHQLRVSAHFLIRRDGQLIQYVPCHMRAWHAGLSSWQGRSGCNDFSIGIELEGSDDQPFAEAQYRQLGWLLEELRKHYPQAQLAGHADIAPGRKTDPGPCFDWSRLRTLA